MLNRYLTFSHQIYDLNVIDRNVIEAFSAEYSRISHYDKKGRWPLLPFKHLWEGCVFIYAAGAKNASRKLTLTSVLNDRNA